MFQYIPKLNSNNISLAREVSSLLRLCLQRPLFHKDLMTLDLHDRSVFFQEVPFIVQRPEEYFGYHTCLVKASPSEKEFECLFARTPLILCWGNYRIIVPANRFVRIVIKPDKIQGKFQRHYFRRLSLQLAREAWFVRKLKLLKVSAILELGCGPKLDLGKKLMEDFKLKRYLGVDIVPNCTNKFYIQHDLRLGLPTFPCPHIVIAHEFIEHLEKSQLSLLVSEIFFSEANAFLFTTPNRGFNSNLKLERRRDDHHFELDRGELMQILAEWRRRHSFSYRIEQLGTIVAGEAPTWAVTLKKN